MLDDFFNFGQESKCKHCLITKKGLKVTEKKEFTELYKKGNPEVAILLEFPEPGNLYSMFLNFLDRARLDNYVVLTSIQCQISGKDLPKPYTQLYSNCELINEGNLSIYPNLKALVPVGRSIYTVTDEFNGYFEFIEYLFNPTYFYTPYQWKNKWRVYPLPSLVDFIRKDNFQKKFATVQLDFVKSFIESGETLKWEKPNLVMVEDPNAFLLEHMDEPEVAWDTETRGGTFNPFRDEFGVICLTMTFDGKTGYFLPFDKINIDLLKQFFAKKRVYITANGKFDDNALYKHGVDTALLTEDVTIMFHALSTERTSNGLKVIAYFLGYGNYEKDLTEYVKAHKITDYGKIPIPLLFPYATLDAIVTFQGYKLAKLLMRKQRGLYEFYQNYLIEVVPVFENAERKGVPIDQEHAKWLHEILLEKTKTIRTKIFEDLGGEMDIDSPQILAKLFEQKGYPCLGMTDSGSQYKVGKDELKEWSRQGYTLASLILEYRTLEKLNGTFVAGTLAKSEKDDEFNILTLSKINSKDDEEENFEGIFSHITSDNLVHATFGIGRADTFRSSCNDPNLMQLPKRGHLAKLYRPVIKPPPGFYLSEADYEGFQLRIAGIYSKDPKIKRIFTELSGDMHSITGHSVFARHITLEDFLKRKKEEPFKTYRQVAKCFVAGTKVMTDKGPMEIQHLVPEVNPGEFTKYEGDTLIIDREKSVKRFESTIFDHSLSTVIIHLENRDKFECTRNHKWPIFRRGKEVTLEAHEIKIGDYFISIHGHIKVVQVTVLMNSSPRKVYCLHEPFNNEFMVVGQSGNQYATKNSLNFGFIFGGGAGAIVTALKNEMQIEAVEKYLQDNNVEITNIAGTRKPDLYYSIARDFRNKFMETYPGIQDWIYSQREVGERLGYIESPFGSRRHVPQLTYLGTQDDRDGEEISNLYNICVNSYVQTFEAATIKKAMRKIFDKFNHYNMKSYIAAMVHDSKVSMLWKPEVKAAYHIIKEEMERDSSRWDIPLVAEVDIGRTWGFAPTVKSDKDLDVLEKGGAYWVHFIDTKSSEKDWEEVIAYDKDHALELAVKSLNSKNIKFELVDRVEMVA